MASFKFIHTADIHLGSTIQLSSEYISKEEEELLVEANYNAFARIVDTAIKEEVDFLLIAGDLYDQEQRSIKANQFFNKQCQRLEEEEIMIYIIAGNHDPLTARQELFSEPNNVIEFSAQEVEEYQIELKQNKKAVNLLGQSYQYRTQRESLHLDYQSKHSDLFNIALLHTQLEANESKYNPASKKELIANQAVDYWALGHIHQCRIESLADPVIAYSGIPQGRDFGEESLGGCLVVEVDQNQQIDYSFLPTANFVWRRIKINLDQLNDTPSNLDQLLDLIQKQAQELAEIPPSIPVTLPILNNKWQSNFKGYIVEWIVTGAVKLHQILTEQPQEAANSLITSLNRLDLNPYSIITTGVKFNTKSPVPDLDELAVNSVVFEELKEMIEDFETEISSDLAEELGSIWQEEVDHEDLDPTKFQLTSDSYQDILEQAKNLIITEILERRD